MAINFTTFFTKFGHAVYSAKNMLQNLGPDQDTVIQSFVDDFDSEALDVKQTIDGTVARLRSIQGQSGGFVSSLISSPLQAFMLQEVKEDLGKNVTFEEAITEFLDQLETAGSTVESSTVSASVTYGGANTGTGELFIDTKNARGEVSQFLINETLTLTCNSIDQLNDSSTFTGKGDIAYGKLSGYYPGGTGIDITLSPTEPSLTSILNNPAFFDADADATTQPANWIAYDADATGSLTDPVSQTLAISGTPTGGYYEIVLKQADGTSELITSKIAYNADASAVQSAIRNVEGYSNVEVTSTGTSPNYTHTITHTNTNRNFSISIRDFTTGGTPLFTISALITDGDFITAGRGLEIAGDGSEGTTYSQEVFLSPDSVYFAHAMVKAQSSIFSGVLQLSLTDAPDGTILQDRAGTNNAISVDLTTIGTTDWYHLGGFFRTGKTLPAHQFFRMDCSTPIDASGTIMVDSLHLSGASQLYAGGPYYALVKGETQFALDDTITLTVANNYSGELQQWFDRIYGLASRGRQIAHSGSPTFADTLITSS